MNYIFSTISTLSHLYKSYALADSLSVYGGFLHLLVIDGEPDFVPENVRVYSLSDIENDLADKIKRKYQRNKDKLRWSFKSVFLLYLLDECDKVIYVDNDIYFFNNFQFLFEKLNQNDILLTPHNYERNPKENQNWFEANFKVGLYNAGFFACNRNAKEVLSWWAMSCLYRCEKNNMRGLFDDQKYLDLVPIMHEKTEVLHHKGCNVAEWNKVVCRREEIDDTILINGKFPIIFYHFNGYSVSQLASDKNNLLFPLLEEYLRVLGKYKSTISLDDIKGKNNLFDKIKLTVWQWLNEINKVS